jgi:type IV secretory pathway VirB2 component (pilin)
MQRASKRIHSFLVAAPAATAAALWPASSWATTGAGFPWDQPLEAVQQTLVGPVAHSFIVMSLIGAVFAYAIAGDSDIARRLAKAAVGVSIALGVLRLMNYVLP